MKTPKLHLTLQRYPLHGNTAGPVYLNPLHVVSVVRANSGKHTEVLTVPGVVYTVEETPEQVLEKVAEIIGQGR